MYAVINLFNPEFLSFIPDGEGYTKKFDTIEEATRELKELHFGVIFDLETNQVVNPEPVIIEVSKGFAYPIEKPVGINLIIRDYDSKDKEDQEQSSFPYDIKISKGKLR